jgi:hypothetical protein
MKSLVFASSVVALITGSSLAQIPNSQNPGPQNQNVPNQAQPAQGANNGGQAQNQSVRDRVQRNLQQAGFTDIKIMPESFLVRAKDRDGNTVMMVINPDSVTAVTEFHHESATTGSGGAGSQRGTAPTQPDGVHK